MYFITKDGGPRWMLHKERYLNLSLCQFCSQNTWTPP